MLPETSFLPPVNKLLHLGQPVQTIDLSQWMPYESLGITTDHAPELLRMVLDADLNDADSESMDVWAPVHAWRALAQLRFEAAVEPLLTLLPRDRDNDDDWLMSDLPGVFGEIGPAAIQALTRYLQDESMYVYSRATVIEGLGAIARRYPDTRGDCLAVMVELLENFETNDDTLNSFLVAQLVSLKAIELLPLIERAFAADLVDPFVTGDLEDIQIELGLKTEREFPRKRLLPDLGLPPDEGWRDTIGIGPRPTVDRAKERLNKKKEKAKRKAADKAKKKKRKK